MSTSSIIIIAAIIAVIVVGAIILAVYHSRHVQQERLLRQRFGPEYDRLAQQIGSKRAAEKELQARERRVEQYHIRALSSDERRQFADRWQAVQAQFVDNPQTSLLHADELLGELMTACGYPVADFDRRAADLSVDHPVVVQHYHAAHAIALRHRKGGATTEDLRQAMIHYRALFDELASAAPQAQAAE